MTEESAQSPDVPVVCPECDSRSRVAIADLAEAVQRHNDNLHDGEDVARVDPDVAAELADVVAEDLGLL